MNKLYIYINLREDMIMGYTSIYFVEELENYTGQGNTAYAVSSVYEGTVSIWDNRDFAYQICEDLELSN